MEISMAVVALACFLVTAGYAERGPRPFVPMMRPIAEAMNSRESGSRLAPVARASAKVSAERNREIVRVIRSAERATTEYLHALGVARRVAERLEGGYPALGRKKRAAARSADLRKLAQSLEVMARKTEKMRAAFGVMRRTLFAAAGKMKPGRRKGAVVPSLDERRAVRAAVYERAARLEVFRRKLGTHAGVLRAQAARVRSRRRGGIDPRYLADSTSPPGALNFLDGRGKRRGTRP